MTRQPLHLAATDVGRRPIDMEETTMSIQSLTRSGAATLAIAVALAAATLAPARAADSPCAAGIKATNNGPEAVMAGQGATSANGDQKAVPDGFGRLVTPDHGTTVPGTPSELAAEKKKGDQAANAGGAPSDLGCK
jgi:hypothetical protein